MPRLRFNPWKERKMCDNEKCMSILLRSKRLTCDFRFVFRNGTCERCELCHSLSPKPSLMDFENLVKRQRRLSMPYFRREIHSKSKVHCVVVFVLLLVRKLIDCMVCAWVCDSLSCDHTLIARYWIRSSVYFHSRTHERSGKESNIATILSACAMSPSY